MTVTKPKQKPAKAPNTIAFSLAIEDAKQIHDALAYCMSTDDSRYYLNGVCLENTKEGLLAVSTDGHRLGRLGLKPMEQFTEGDKTTWKMCSKPISAIFSFIAPRSFIKRLGQISSDLVTNTCTITIDNGWIYYSDANQGFSAKLIDGTYPDWRKVLPADTEKQEPTVAYNAQYMAQIASALAKVHGKNCPVAIKVKDGLSPTVLHSRRNKDIDLTYVLMPMRF